MMSNNYNNNNNSNNNDNNDNNDNSKNNRSMTSLGYDRHSNDCIVEGIASPLRYVIERTALTDKTKMRFDNSPSKVCKKIFRLNDIGVPTSFIVLPYELKFDRESKQLYASSEDQIKLSEEIGMHLLTMNKITARLSFWMAMDNYVSKSKQRRKKIMEWMNRSRQEKNTKLIASEIVTEVRVGSTYIKICREVLEKHDKESNAKAYIDDPMEAAKNEFKQCTDAILKCFKDCKRLFFYLVDEYSWVPVSSISYPIHVWAKKSYLLENLFLQFMSISSMAATAVDGLMGLVRLLGLPPSLGIPSSWTSGKPGLVHGSNHSSSVAKFASLQREIRGQQVIPSIAVDTGEKQFQQQVPPEVLLILKFYKKYDPNETFSNLLRVSDSEGSKIWIRRTVWQRIEAQTKKRRLKQIAIEKQKIEDVEEEVKMLMVALRKQKVLDDVDFSHSYHASSATGPSELSQAKGTVSKRGASQKGYDMIQQGKKKVSSLWTCDCN